MNVKKTAANGILVVAILLFLIAYPWRADVWAGLIVHMSGAAVIGGFADWYAVTALFSKPLGFPYKTAIIPRRRDRIIDMAREMVEKELLTPNNIYKGIKDQKPVAKLIEYLLSDDGKEAVYRLCEEVLTKPAAQMDLSCLWRNLVNRTQIGISEWNISPYTVTLLRRLSEPKLFALLWRHIHKVIGIALQSEGIRGPLRQLLENALNRYEQNNQGRQILHAFAENLIQMEDLVRILQNSMVSYWYRHAAPSNLLAERMKDYFLQSATRLETDSVWQAKVDSFKNSVLERFVEDYQAEEFQRLQAELLESGGGMKFVADKIFEYLSDLYGDEGARYLPERTVLFQVAMSVSSLSSFAGKMAEEVLANYSAETLGKSLSSHVHNDLQMIRINGTLVGGALGGIFYGLALLVKGGIGI